MSRPIPKKTTSAPGLSAAARRLRLKETLRVRDYGKLLLRPIKPEDEPLMVEFHRTLSEESIYSRYFEHMTLECRTKHDRLARICANDDDSFALVAEFPGNADAPRAIFGVGRLSRTDDPLAADFAILVKDAVQGRGIGSALIKRLMTLARACKFNRLTGEVLVTNHEMIYVCRHFGFSVQHMQDGLVQVNHDL
ncbi:MAG: GNAT family N-acetyltransferase [Methylacidiphilales bacterium]|nr:GNAT family N-acetyltransferase [Candidatus Methylacidiphilales bacterium]